MIAMRPRISPFTLIAGIALAAIVLGAVAAPWLAGDPLDTSRAALQTPSTGTPLGTDLLGRDVWSRLLWGGRRTLGMGAMAGGIAVALGLVFGLAAGLPRSRWLAPLLLRVIDALLAFPGLLLALLLVTIAVGQNGVHAGPWPVAVAAGLSGAPGFARLTYGVLHALAQRPWVEAAEAIGATRRRVLLVHLLPNAGGTLLVYATLQVGWSLLGVTGLAFLGLAGGPAIPEWGSMLAEARLALPAAPWVATAPAVAITATVFAVNVLGDAMVDRYAAP
jgi:ABC-type dipeptide/oligopeptide/nickel transport system permease subunit